MKHNVQAGFRVGELVVIQRVAPKTSGAINLRNRVRVECSCGTRETIPTYYLTRQYPKQNCGGPAHKSQKSRFNEEYRIWIMMRRRCNNDTHVSYKYYGGRGIKVCPEWDNDKDGFEKFLAYVGPRPSSGHSIDRFPDVNGGYYPGNVRWATDIEQANNKRPKVNPVDAVHNLPARRPSDGEESPQVQESPQGASSSSEVR